MRRQYVRTQRERFDRRSVAVLPVHYPKEILTALGILSVEMWGPPGPPRGDAAGRLQTYVCAVARNALAFLGSGGADVVDGVLFPHTCDSLQGLATLVGDFGGWEKKAFVFQHPRGEERPAARAFAEREMRALARSLGELGGRALDDATLAQAVALHERVDAARAALLDARAHLPMTDAELYALLRRGEWLWPEDHLDELFRAFEKRCPRPVQKGLPILATGYVPEPFGLLDALNAAGLYIAADDYAAVGRRIVRNGANGSGDAWGSLLSRYFALPPCPTRGSDQARRMRHLESLAAHAGARGVLVHVQKFCEPELFDVAAIRRTFGLRGIPVLVLEGELEPELSAQAETRIEAFAEMLHARGA